MPPFAKIKSAVKTACAKAVKIARRILVSKPFAAFCAGALTVLALPPYHILPALLGFTALGFLLAGDMTKKRTFGIGFSFGFAHFGFGLMWVGNALKLDPRFAPVSFLPFFAFGLWGAFFPAFCALTARVLAPSGWRRAVVFAAGWGFFEWVRSWALTGFPWNLTASVFTDAPLMLQTASLYGSYGLGVMIVLACFLPAAALPFDNRKAFFKRLGAWTGVSALVFACLAAYGYARFANAFLPDDFVRGVKFRLVQPNVEQTLKWDSQKAERILDDHVFLTSREPKDDITHVVWSETATQFLLAQDEYARAMAVSGLPQSAILLAGTLRTEKVENPDAFPPMRVYNSIAAINEIGSVLGLYDKAHLVPFGEYVPLRSVFPFMEKVTNGQFDFSRGKGAQTVSVPRTLPAGMLICYEILFPAHVVDKSQRPYWLLNVTNDGWYGISAGPHQHFAAAVLRAVEEGLPVVRAANTGISGVIDSYGRVVNALALGKRGIVDSGLPRAEDETFYGARGNDVPLTMCALLILFSFLPAIVKKKQKE